MRKEDGNMLVAIALPFIALGILVLAKFLEASANAKEEERKKNHKDK